MKSCQIYSLVRNLKISLCIENCIWGIFISLIPLQRSFWFMGRESPPIVNRRVYQIRVEMAEIQLIHFIYCIYIIAIKFVILQLSNKQTCNIISHAHQFEVVFCCLPAVESIPLPPALCSEHSYYSTVFNWFIHCN